MYINLETGSSLRKRTLLGNSKKLLTSRCDFWIAIAISLLHLIVFIAICFVVSSRHAPSESTSSTVDCSGFKTETISALPSIKSNYLECEFINIAIVCGGFNSTRSFYTLLKSILFYRVGARLNLHLFVDNISSLILKELFRTWHVSDLEVFYYNVSDFEQEISWLPSSHYSHRYGLLKLVLPSILASRGLRRVILLDTDMLVLGNIRSLWAKQSALDSSNAFLALVENQSNWYLDSRSWPASGRGFNTGMMVMDLVKMRRANWTEMWRQVTEAELIAQLSTTLADQDVYNAVIKKHSWIHVELPCQFNIQLNDNTEVSKTCPQYQHTNFNLVHWNSPHKLATKNNLSRHFNGWYEAFRVWNGRLLERQGCPTVPLDEHYLSYKEIDEGQGDIYVNSMTSDVNKLCKEIKPGPYERVRTWLYFRDFELSSKDNDLQPQTDIRYDVTLSVHLSIDRLHALDELASHWAGPISAAVYLPEAETDALRDLIEISTNMSKRKNIGLHLAFKDHGLNYPINLMRNIALNNTVTPYVLLLDVDFLPSKNLYTYLTQTVADIRENWGFFRDNQRTPQDKIALVIPAFETLEYKFEFPENKAALRDQVDLGKVSQFRQQIWSPGQKATNYDKWWQASMPYIVDWQRDYEPYILAMQNVSRFDERFVGFGWNKVEHITWLAAQEYEFLVLPEAFIIHKAHSASNDIIKHRTSQRYRACTRRLEIDFMTRLSNEYPAFFEREFGPPRTKRI